MWKGSVRISDLPKICKRGWGGGEKPGWSDTVDDMV